jgi:hypothetical protein
MIILKGKVYVLSVIRFDRANIVDGEIHHYMTFIRSETQPKCSNLE